MYTNAMNPASFQNSGQSFGFGNGFPTGQWLGQPGGHFHNPFNGTPFNGTPMNGIPFSGQTGGQFGVSPFFGFGPYAAYTSQAYAPNAPFSNFGTPFNRFASGFGQGGYPTGFATGGFPQFAQPNFWQGFHPFLNNQFNGFIANQSFANPGAQQNSPFGFGGTPGYTTAQFAPIGFQGSPFGAFNSFAGNPLAGYPTYANPSTPFGGVDFQAACFGGQAVPFTQNFNTPFTGPFGTLPAFNFNALNAPFNSTPISPAGHFQPAWNGYANGSGFNGLQAPTFVQSHPGATPFNGFTPVNGGPIGQSPFNNASQQSTACNNGTGMGIGLTRDVA